MVKFSAMAVQFSQTNTSTVVLQLLEQPSLVRVKLIVTGELALPGAVQFIEVLF